MEGIVAHVYVCMQMYVVNLGCCPQMPFPCCFLEAGSQTGLKIKLAWPACESQGCDSFLPSWPWENKHESTNPFFFT